MYYLLFGLQKVNFEISDATKRHLDASTFDIIYSRDTIIHIVDKLSLFKSFYVCWSISFYVKFIFYIE